MARAFLPEDDVFVAVLDETERVVLSGLMQQTRLLLSPEVETTGDVFDDLVSSMGGPLAPGDQESETVVGPSGPQDVTDRDPALDRLLPTAHRLRVPGRGVGPVRGRTGVVGDSDQHEVAHRRSFLRARGPDGGPGALMTS